LSQPVANSATAENAAMVSSRFILNPISELTNQNLK
jgi:hypothetical protein